MSIPALRLIFMGTPAFSVPTLQTLVSSRHQVVAVYSQPPRPSGRGHQIQKSAVQLFAESQGIAVFTPNALKDPNIQAEFASHQADAAIVVAYGLLLPQPLLDAPRLGCINVHASLLPRWRGAAPIQRAIEAGDSQSGITIMKMDAGLDTGPMLISKSIPVPQNMTTSQLHDSLSKMGGPLLLEALEGYAAGTLHPIPQPTDGITYAEKLSREESQLNWQSSAKNSMRKIQAFTPWPSIWFECNGTHIKVFEAEVIDNISAEPGTVMDDQLTVACGEGALRLKMLQKPGSSILDTQSFLRGYPIPAGTVLPCPVTN
jgi:methionyl-tRNA formyltransferase